jgi:uncharacterized membrane protein
MVLEWRPSRHRGTRQPIFQAIMKMPVVLAVLVGLIAGVNIGELICDPVNIILQSVKVRPRYKGAVCNRTYIHNA